MYIACHFTLSAYWKNLGHINVKRSKPGHKQNCALDFLLFNCF